MDSALETLLQQQSVWRCREGEPGLSAGSDASVSSFVVASGYNKLDDYLPGGGWPRHALIEVLSGDSGIGELRLFMPALAALAARQPGYIVWIGAPYQAYAPALAQWGLDVSRVLVIQASQTRDVLWASAEALNSGSALAVLSWLPELDVTASRRLQLAAVKGRSMAVVFRPLSARQQSSAASLRMSLCHGSQGTEIDFFKVRGASPQRICNYDNTQGFWPGLTPATPTHATRATSVPG